MYVILIFDLEPDSFDRTNPIGLLSVLIKAYSQTKESLDEE